MANAARKTIHVEAEKVEAEVKPVEVTSLKALADEFVKADKKLKDVIQQQNLKKEEIREQVSTLYESYGAEGKFTRTFQILGEKTDGVLVSFRDNFKSLPAEKRELIVKEIGEENFKNLFEEQVTITLKDSSQSTLEILKKRLGPKVFDEYFKSETKLVTKTNADVAQFSLPKKARAFLKQNEAAVSVAKKERE